MSWIPEDRLFLPKPRKDSSMNQCLFVFLHEAASILSSSGAPTSMAREPLQLNNNTIKHYYEKQDYFVLNPLHTILRSMRERAGYYAGRGKVRKCH